MAQDEDVIGIIAENHDEISAVLAASIESSSKPVEISPEDASWVDSCFTSDFNWDTLKAALLESLDPPTNVSDDDGEYNSDIVKEEYEEETKVEVYEVVHERVVDVGDDKNDIFLKFKQESDWRDDIFKVWDLEIDDELENEENELISQLNKALRVKKYQGLGQIDAKEVDDLAANMGNLSLKPSVN